MRLKLSENPGEWRKFVWSCGAAATLFTALGWWRGRVSPSVVGGVALVAMVLACVAWWRPAWFRGFYRGGRTVSHWMGRIVGTVLLTVLFVLVLVPLGLALRIAGKDPLRLRREPGNTSYWREARPPGSFERMF